MLNVTFNEHKIEYYALLKEMYYFPPSILTAFSYVYSKKNDATTITTMRSS